MTTGAQIAEILTRLPSLVNDNGPLVQRGRFLSGEFLVEASEDQDELVTADMDMEKVREVRNLWQFFRDRRPETYGPLTAI